MPLVFGGPLDVSVGVEGGAVVLDIAGVPVVSLPMIGAAHGAVALRGVDSEVRMSGAVISY
jgi:hypothetical protein